MSRARSPSLRHRLEYTVVLAARGVERVLGARAAGALAAAAGRLAYRPLGIRRPIVEAHLRQAFPDRDEPWIRRTAAAAYAHLGREAMSLLRLSRLGPADVVRETRVDPGFDELRAAVEQGNGAVLITGHFGNWEVGGAAIAARGIPLDVVAQGQRNPLLNRLINRTRERLGMRVIDRGRATREALRSLRTGRVVAFVADQDARRAGIFVPFLGRPASTFRGPAVLALRSGAPVFIGTAVREPAGGYALRIERIPTPEGVADPEAQTRQLTAAHARALEAAVRAEPPQYFWHHRRWKTVPPPSAERGEGPAV